MRLSGLRLFYRECIMNRIVFLVISTIMTLTIGVASAFGASSDTDSVASKVIHTAKTSLAVNQMGQVGDQVPGSSFTYFANPTKDYLRDGSLILGNGADNLSWAIFRKTQPAPYPDNPYGPMLPMSDLTIDSTSSPSYMVAFGKGTNRDSTIGFDVAYYAPKHIDSGDFYIAHFQVYKGVKNPLSTYSPLMIAFATDWDIPSDSGANNSGGHIYQNTFHQRGETSAAMQRQFGAVAAFREGQYSSEYPIKGAFIWDNMTHVYPFSGFQTDSIWKYATQSGYFNGTTAIADLSTVVVVGKNFIVHGAMHDTIRFHVVLSGQLDGSPTGLQRTIDQAEKFFCSHVWNPSFGCYCGDCCNCGDANLDNAINISDAVFIIQYIFAGGVDPMDCFYMFAMGDANGDRVVNISDAVYLIAYIFAGGSPPHCNGM
jgi:hypothetical protein